MSDDNAILPWTIRGIPPEARNAATAAAKRDGVQIGEWIERAIREKVKGDRQKRSVISGKPPVDLGRVSNVIEMMGALSAASGEPPPASLSKQAYAMLRAGLSDIKSGKSDNVPKKEDTSVPLSDQE